jgi:hypothetical protein
MLQNGTWITASPNARLISFKPGLPLATMSRAIWSQSTTGTPMLRITLVAVLFPVDIPPVKPTIRIALNTNPLSDAGERGRGDMELASELSGIIWDRKKRDPATSAARDFFFYSCTPPP